MAESILPMPIHIGFFRDFGLSDTLLIEGDLTGLRQLADVFRQLVEGGGSTAIHELPFVTAHHGIRVVASTADRDFGASMKGLDVSWKRSRTGWQETAETVNALATTTAAHQYLDVDEDEVTVMASCGEYGDDWWAQNG